MSKIYIILENPKNKENIGLIMRSMLAFNINHLIIIDERKEYKLSKFKKEFSSISAGISLNKSIMDNIIIFNTVQETIDFLHINKYISIATSPHFKQKNNIKLNELYISYKKIAFWFGNEARGLSEEALANKHCKICVQIPLNKQVESLNLALCVGIVLYAISII